MSDYEFEQAGPLPADMKESFAVIYAPRRQRQRYPENTVYVQESQEAALAAADKGKNLFAARVCGPFRSSEGFMLYYLVAWLDGAE